MEYCKKSYGILPAKNDFQNEKKISKFYHVPQGSKKFA
jgi:hypothetical protein